MILLDKLNSIYYNSPLPDLPRIIMIEPTNACNLRCIMCDYQNTKDGTSFFLSLDNFKKIFDQFSDIREFIFCGIGEPLLNKDIFEMIRIVKERKVPFINLITNGTLLNEEYSQRLLESGITRIQISIHSANSKTFAYVRQDKEEAFEQVKENIKVLIKFKKNFPNIKICINTVINHSNFKEMPDIIELGSELGVDLVEFFQMTTIFDKLKDINAPLSQVPSLVKQARKFAKRLKVNLSFLDGNEYGRCYQLWDFIMIHSDGNVSPCNGIMPQEKIDVGNILKTPLKDIWYSDKYQELRRLVKNNKLKNCQFCESGYRIEGLNLRWIKNYYIRPLKRILKERIRGC